MVWTVWLIQAAIIATAYTPSVIASPVDHQYSFTLPKFPSSEWTTFNHPIKHVAVIGAGPSGLQAAATLQAEGFSVRLFERASDPGGNWNHNVLTPIRESYPNRPIEEAAYVPDLGRGTEYYQDGDEIITLIDRWREHSRPSPVWDNLFTNSPGVITSLPGVTYPVDAPWVLPAPLVQRLVRAYASSQSLNVRDPNPNQSSASHTSYTTRVELLEKNGTSWILSLRKLELLPLSSKARVNWWQEKFDAVVVASGGYDVAYVPNITGLVAWSKLQTSDGRYPVAHSQSYRNPNHLKGKVAM